MWFWLFASILVPNPTPSMLLCGASLVVCLHGFNVSQLSCDFINSIPPFHIPTATSILRHSSSLTLPTLSLHTVQGHCTVHVQADRLVSPAQPPLSLFWEAHPDHPQFLCVDWPHFSSALHPTPHTLFFPPTLPTAPQPSVPYTSMNITLYPLSGTEV